MLILLSSCSEDPDVKGTETTTLRRISDEWSRCSEDPDVKGTETDLTGWTVLTILVAARIPM